MNLLGSPLARFLMIAFVEGWSFLILLFVAMPLKHRLDEPLAVEIVGRIHGGLFVLYVVSAFEVVARHRFGGVGRSAGFLLAAAVASVVPFGTFVLDRWLMRWPPARVAISPPESR